MVQLVKELNSNASFPNDVAWSVVELEEELNQILKNDSKLDDEPWVSTPLMTFLDGAPTPSVLQSAVVVLMKSKVVFILYCLHFTVNRDLIFFFFLETY